MEYNKFQKAILIILGNPKITDLVSMDLLRPDKELLIRIILRKPDTSLIEHRLYHSEHIHLDSIGFTMILFTIPDHFKKVLEMYYRNRPSNGLIRLIEKHKNNMIMSHNLQPEDFETFKDVVSLLLDRLKSKLTLVL